MAPFIIIGSLLGAYVASRMASTHLKNIFGVIEIMIAVLMYYEFSPRALQQLPGRPMMALVSSTIGFISALAGIGGGTMTVPFLAWCNVTIHKAIASFMTAPVGARLAHQLPTKKLRHWFAIFLLVIGLTMLDV